MQIFKKNYQPQVSQKFQIDFSDFSLSEVKVPKYNEYIGTIYLFVNNINGKVYVGQTITKFYSRFCCHFGDTFRKIDNLPFHNALRKYGWENFSKYILWQTDGVYDKTPENKKLVKNVLDSKKQNILANMKLIILNMDTMQQLEAIMFLNLLILRKLQKRVIKLGKNITVIT